MRRRNRKKTLHAQALPAPWVGVVMVAVTVALGYVWTVARSQTLGNELRALEQKRDALLKSHAHEQFKWTRMKSPENLERELRDRGIAMTWPSSRQVVRLRAADVHSDWPDAGEPQLAGMERGMP